MMKMPETGKDTNVLRKTPTEIKTGLEKCSNDRCICDECEFSNDNVKKWRILMSDALAYIQQLEYELGLCRSTINAFEKTFRDFQSTNDKLITERDDLKSRIAQAERERKAMHRDMKLYCRCKACKKFVDGEDCPLHSECTYGNENLFEWRGPCPENTKEDSHEHP